MRKYAYSFMSELKG